MQFMRYINLFSRKCNVMTKNCFVYNNQIFFVVPRSQVSKAIGKDAVNIKSLRDILRRKIRVIAAPSGEGAEAISEFVESIVSPIEFNKLEIRDYVVTITAGRQSKAALIGRNRAREKELTEILRNNFGIMRVRIA